MKFDRKLQFTVLKALEEVYPDSLLVDNLPEYSNERPFMGSLFYLQEHGLIAGGDIRLPGQCRSMVDVQITKKGLDFLADDGGLQAILGRFSIKYEKDELITIIEKVLANGEAAQNEISEIVESLNALDEEKIKHIFESLIAFGVEGNHEKVFALLYPTG